MSEDDPGGSRTTLAERRGEDVEVYKPAEDSALLAGEVCSDLGGANPAYILDVGTGSGYVGARLAGETDARVIGIDINPTAARRATEHGVETVTGDLVSPFRDDVFDIVTFNPPYLPVDDTATWDDWFDAAVTGGETGRETIERFLDDVGRVLTPDGAVYLVISSLTGVDAVVEYAATHGFSAVALSDTPFPGETLTVLKLRR